MKKNISEQNDLSDSHPDKVKLLFSTLSTQLRDEALFSDWLHPNEKGHEKPGSFLNKVLW